MEQASRSDASVANDPIQCIEECSSGRADERIQVEVLDVTDVYFQLNKTTHHLGRRLYK